MARIIPNQVLLGKSVAYARVLRLCKNLPNEYTVWQRMAEESPADLWICRNESQYLQIVVSDITGEEIRNYVQPDFFGDASGLFEEKRSSLNLGIPHLLLVFPLLSRSAVQALGLGSCPRLSRESINGIAFLASVERHLSERLNDEAISNARMTFCPEVVIPESLCLRGNILPGSTTLQLDVNQEELLKNGLSLEASDGDLNARLVTGVAGSGKSLLVLFRARLLRTMYGRRVSTFVLAHNRALIRDLEARYLVLSGGDRDVRFNTFLAWCHDHWPEGFAFPSPISEKQRIKVARECIETHLSDLDIEPERLLEEIDWYKDSFRDHDAYLASDRSGRGFRLNEAQRRQVYAAIMQYQETLDAAALLDWGDVPRMLWEGVEAGRVTLPFYDTILIDEAQFFAPYWFTLLKAMTRNLFIVADPTQGFLKRRQSWSALGIEIRGRAYRLERSYRTTRSIMNFANLLYRDRVPDDGDAILMPDLQGRFAGVMPTVIPLKTPQEELARVVEEVEVLIDHGIEPRDVLIIHADPASVDPLIQRLNKILNDSLAVRVGEKESAGALRIGSLDICSGLESPVVFLLGIHQLYEREQHHSLSEHERAELIRENTRKLYMAITRTGQRLVITYVGVMPRVLANLS